MALRILHTSDLHLGMKFAGYPDAQTVLAEERFHCLERVVEEANARRCDLLVVAGDLFDRVSVAARDVLRAAETIRGFQGRLAAVLPGNHDFLSPGDELWPRFRDACAGSVLLLEEPTPYPLLHFDLDACLYPGPCTSKHSKSNAVGWVRGSPRPEGIGLHIGVAHGSLQGFSPDFSGEYYPMNLQELREACVDLWLMGHTHARYPETPGRTERIFFAGTPEPDGFDCAHEGWAWALEIGDDGEVNAEPVRTGRLRFVDESVRIEGAADLRAFETRYSGPGAGATLLRARLSGRAPRNVIEEVSRARERMAGTLLHADLGTEGLREEITPEAIDREFVEESFPHTLLRTLADAEDLEALEIAHELLGEARR
jgi:DNA repair exonuclease SbcCD nuclease subunit